MSSNLINKASCLIIWNLAENATLNQIKSLNPKEREVISHLASSILEKDRPFPHVDPKVMDGIKTKLKEEAPLQRGLVEKIVTSIQKFFSRSPSSEFIQGQIQNIKNNRFQEISKEIERYENIKTGIKEEIDLERRFVPIYQGLEEPIKGLQSMKAADGQKQLRVKLQENLKNIKNVLEEVINKIPEEKFKNFQAYLTKIEDYEKQISNTNLEIPSLLAISLDLDQHFSSSLSTAITNFNNNQKLLKHYETLLANLKETQKLVTHSKEYIDSIRNDLQNRIEEISRDISKLDTKNPQDKVKYKKLIKELQEIKDLLEHGEFIKNQQSLEDLKNKISCLMIFDLAAKTTAPIENLNTKERQAVSQIANSILKEQPFPHIDLKMIETINSKLNRRLLTKEEGIVNYVQKLFKIRPSTGDIQSKINEIKTIKLPIIQEKIEQQSKEHGVLETRIRRAQSCLKIYQEIPKIYDFKIEKDLKRSNDMFFHQKDEFQKLLETKLKDIKQTLIEARSKTQEGDDLWKRLTKDLDEIESHQTRTSGFEFNLSLEEEVKKLDKYFSKRLVEENKELNHHQEVFKLVDSNLAHLKESRKLLVEISNREQAIHSIRNDLQNKIDEISKDLSKLDVSKRPEEKEKFKKLTKELQEIVDLLTLSEIPEERLPAPNDYVMPGLSKLIQKEQALENSKSIRKSCLLIYGAIPKFYNNLKAHMEGGFTTTGEKRERVGEEIGNIIDLLTLAKKEIQGESLMERKFNEDMVKTIDEWKKMNETDDASFDASFDQILKDMATYFSSRLEEEKNDLKNTEVAVIENKKEIINLVEGEIEDEIDIGLELDSVIKTYQDRLTLLEDEISKGLNDPKLEKKADEANQLRFILHDIIEDEEFSIDKYEDFEEAWSDQDLDIDSENDEMLRENLGEIGLENNDMKILDIGLESPEMVDEAVKIAVQENIDTFLNIWGKKSILSVDYLTLQTCKQFLEDIKEENKLDRLNDLAIGLVKWIKDREKILNSKIQKMKDDVLDDSEKQLLADYKTELYTLNRISDFAKMFIKEKEEDYLAE